MNTFAYEFFIPNIVEQKIFKDSFSIMSTYLPDYMDLYYKYVNYTYNGKNIYDFYDKLKSGAFDNAPTTNLGKGDLSWQSDIWA